MIEKFKVAFRGLFIGFRDISIRTQWILACLAVLAGTVMGLKASEWIAVIVCIGLVITAEMLNTCIEKLCDMLTDTYDTRVKYIKDLAAGAVLVSSIAALFTALIILYLHMKGV